MLVIDISLYGSDQYWGREIEFNVEKRVVLN